MLAPRRGLVGTKLHECVCAHRCTGHGRGPSYDHGSGREDSGEKANGARKFFGKPRRQGHQGLEKLDFKEVGGKLEENWIVLQNGSARIGLFQGMFDKNIMTFNPGWSKDKETLKDFQDVRELQRTLKARGLRLSPEADEATEGPAFFMVSDPDGNTLLFDQHVPSPKR